MVMDGQAQDRASEVVVWIPSREVEEVAFFDAIIAIH